MLAPICLPALAFRVMPTGSTTTVRSATGVKLAVPQWRVLHHAPHAPLLPPRVRPLALPLLLVPPTSLIPTTMRQMAAKLVVRRWTMVPATPAPTKTHAWPSPAMPTDSTATMIQPTGASLCTTVLQLLLPLTPPVTPALMLPLAPPSQHATTESSTVMMIQKMGASRPTTATTYSLLLPHAQPAPAVLNALLCRYLHHCQRS